MSVLRPVLRSVLSSVLRPVLAGHAAVKRYFTRLDPTQHFTIPANSSAGNFDIQIDYYTEVSSVHAIVGSTDNNNLFYINSDNTLRCRIGGGVFHNFGPIPDNIGVLNTARMRRSVGVVVGSINGTDLPNSLSSTDTFVLNAIARGSALFF